MVRYLHKNNILFRDFKAENVLLDYYGHLKLTDFGLARKIQLEDGRANYSFCGSPIYIAPETLERKPYDHKVDYYALGILLFEMLTGQPPYNFKQADLIKNAKIN
jgi:serine/threonine protein kinase